MRIVIDDGGVYVRKMDDGISMLYPLTMLSAGELMAVETAMNDAGTAVRRRMRKKAKEIAKNL